MLHYGSEELIEYLPSKSGPGCGFVTEGFRPIISYVFRNATSFTRTAKGISK